MAVTKSVNDATKLIALLDANAGDALSQKRLFQYRDYYDHNNIKIVRGIHSKDDRVNFLLPDNPECTEKDWWLLYAVNALNLADAYSIARYIEKIKTDHKEMLFTADSVRIIVRRLNLLSRLGFLTKHLYVVNTDIDIDDAQEAYDIRARQKEDEYHQKTELNQPIMSVDDEYMDEESTDEISLVSYSTAEYSRYLKQKKTDSYMRGKNKYAVLNDERNRVAAYFGKNSRLVTLYGIEEDTLRLLRDRFGSNIPYFKGNLVAKLSCEQMGIAATGYVASKFCTLPSFHNFKSGWVKGRFGVFLVPVEMEFRIFDREGIGFSYNCGLFYSFYSRMTGRTLPSHDKSKIYETITNIKNYLGIKGITKKTNDAFALVVVNDTEDLQFFADALVKTTAVTDAEIARIFFTGEGILQSDISPEFVIGLDVDMQRREQYGFKAVRLPIVK